MVEETANDCSDDRSLGFIEKSGYSASIMNWNFGHSMMHHAKNELASWPANGVAP